MKKRLLSLLLCLITVFSLAACGGNTDPDASTGSSSSSSSSSSSDVKKEDPKKDDGTDELKGFDSSMDHLFLATDIRNHSIVVFDLNACDGDFELLKQDSIAVVWEWKSDEDPTCTIKPGDGIDAAKLRYSPYYKKTSSLPVLRRAEPT